jgi:hypothetical protein
VPPDRQADPAAGSQHPEHLADGVRSSTPDAPEAGHDGESRVLPWQRTMSPTRMSAFGLRSLSQPAAGWHVPKVTSPVGQGQSKPLLSQATVGNRVHG